MEKIDVTERASAAHAALNAVEASFPADSTISELFERRVEEYPERLAVVYRDRCLDYRSLNRQADLLAAALRRQRVRPGDFVGVCVERSPELVVALLAVLKCGAAYVPFDEAWPDVRLRDLFEQCHFHTVVTDRAERLRQRTVARGLALVPADRRAGPESGAGGVRVSPEALAYVNFTSGSTGRPKGVPIQHRAVVRLISGAVYARLDASTRLLQFAPVTFDAATFEIWGALLHGGTCVLYPSRFLRFSELRTVLTEQRVTTVFLTTALFNSIVDEAPQTLDGVRTILTGGEAHSLEHIGKALARYGPGRLTSVYGPTESTTFATYHPVHRLPSQGGLPIGVPIQHTRAYVVGGEGLCEPGRTGELLLAGPGLSPGYLGMAELTAERFIERCIDGVAERLYRTGDLVHIDPDGHLVFEGRLDDQVKINGFRVEPGEVSRHLATQPDVRQNYVTAHIGASGERELIAFVVPRAPGLSARSVRDFLAQRLPAYMLPGDIRLLPSLPLLANGKTDRTALLSAAYPSEREPSR